MARALAVKLPEGMLSFFDNPPLVGLESLEEYQMLFGAVAGVIKPQHILAWLCVERVTDLAWSIRRERGLKKEIIKICHKEIVGELLGDKMFGTLFSDACAKANQWEIDPKVRSEINHRLAKEGHTPDAVLAQAYMRGADQIDASDKRVSSYEARSIALLKEASLYSVKLSDEINRVSTDVIDGDFSDTAE